MKKVKVNLGLQNYSASEKVELARSIVTAMTANANFTTPNPALSAVTLAATNLDSALQAAQDKGKTKIALAHAAEATLANLLTQLSLYVEITANNDNAKILSSGMIVKHSSKTPQQLAAPLCFTATNTTNEGEVIISWKRVKNAHAYIIELSDDVAATTNPTSPTTIPLPSANRVFISWSFADVVTKSRCIISNLASATKYAFRVYAVGSAGKGNRSTSVVVKVL